jgi:hypothetical protein
LLAESSRTAAKAAARAAEAATATATTTAAMHNGRGNCYGGNQQHETEALLHHGMTPCL